MRLKLLICFLRVRMQDMEQLSKVVWFTGNTLLIKCAMNALELLFVCQIYKSVFSLFKLKYIYKSGNILYKHVIQVVLYTKGLKIWHNLQQKFKIKIPCYAWKVYSKTGAISRKEVKKKKIVLKCLFTVYCEIQLKCSDCNRCLLLFHHSSTPLTEKICKTVKQGGWKRM